MDVHGLLKDAKNLTDYQFEQRLDRLVRENSSFRNLDEKNKDVLFDLLKKHRDKLRKGIGISYNTVRDEGYELYEKRLKLNLTQEDIDDIKKILNMFR